MNKKAVKISTLAAAALIFQAVLFVLAAFIMSRANLDMTRAPYYVLAAVFSAAVSLFPAAALRLATRKSEDTPVIVIKTRSEKNDDVLFTAGCAALVFAVGIIYERIFPESAMNVPVNAETTAPMHILMITALCVVPAVCEEIFFRKILARSFAVSSNMAAVIISALTFGLAHFSMWEFPYAFFAGLVFGVLYFRTGSVKYTIAAHFFCNLTSYLFAWAKTVMPSGAYGTFEIITMATFAAVAVLTSFIYFKSHPVKKDGADGKADAFSLITPAMVIYIVAAGIIILLR